MTRAYVSATAAIVVAVLAAVFMISQTATAQQERPCGDRTRQALAVRLARQINTLEINSRPRTNSYQPMSAFPQISVPVGFTAQLVINATGSEYVFSVKDTQDPCGLTVFSDQDQVIYTGQPIQPTR
jgi:hypothetical protein